MSDLMLPSKGKSAASLLQDLNADHAPHSPGNEGTNVTTLQETNELSNEGTNDSINAETGVTEPARVKKSRSEPAGTAPPKNNKQNHKATGQTPSIYDAVIHDTTVHETPPDGIESDANSPRIRPPRASVEREGRYARALEQGQEDEISVVTVRVSGRLNEYMDRYIERINRLHPKRRYRKQDAVAEAFAAFYADHPMPPAPKEDDL